MFQVRQTKADQIGFLRLQHLSNVRIASEAKFSGPGLRFFQGASGDRTKRDIRPPRKNAGVLPSPLPPSDETDFDRPGAGPHCSITTLPVSPPKKNASNARWISSTPIRCVMIWFR